MSPKRVALYIDPPSHHFRNDRLFQVDDWRPNGDRMNAPYAHLRSLLSQYGVATHTGDLMPPESAVDGTTKVFVSMGTLSNYHAVGRRQDTILSAFFAMECPIIEPSIFRALPEVQRHFRHVLSWSDGPALQEFTGGELLGCEPFRWPQGFDDVHPVWSRTADRKFLVMINSNKLPQLYRRELYTERLRAVEFFEPFGEIDLFGPGWDQPSNRVGSTWIPYTGRLLLRKVAAGWQRLRPNPRLLAARRVWRGLARSKAETLGGYTYALCFENMIMKGWITEKIFDCLFAGTVPIYWGAPEIAEVIPPECFIDMRNFAGYADLRRFLKALGPMDVQRYREHGRDFVHSAAFRPFSMDAFAQIFCQLIEQDAGIRLR
ncbi:MAG: glycosyltransferase family 10 domain-containing protein [Chloroflexota bacterium]